MDTSLAKGAVIAADARELIGGDAFAMAFVSDPSVGFTVEGAESGRDRLLVGIGASLRLSPRAQLGFGYDGDLSADDQQHAATARFRFDF